MDLGEQITFNIAFGNSTYYFAVRRRATIIITDQLRELFLMQIIFSVLDAHY